MSADILARWAHLYSDHKAVSITVTYIHLAGVLLGGGLAVAADRDVLVSAPAPDLMGLRPPHRVIVTALVVIGASGLLMLLADLHTYVTSAVFWTKMGFILLLIGNGVLRLKAERTFLNGAAAAWVRIRRTSIASVVLWFLILLAGTIIGSS
jgi:hypothetical protein